MGRYLDVTKAPKVHTDASGSTYGKATVDLFGHARAASLDPMMDGDAFVGTDDGLYARADHIHPSDTSRAPIVFGIDDKLTGTPRAETPEDDSDDDRIATTEWVRKTSVYNMMNNDEITSAVEQAYETVKNS